LCRAGVLQRRCVKVRERVPHSPKENSPSNRFKLRVLATSDVHARLLAFDYFHGTQTAGGSLARIATLVGKERAEAGACLLLDNGDFLQGEPIADVDLATVENAGNPIVQTMNAMGYDAVGLGNHEFDLDAPLLRASLANARYPTLCANLLPVEGDPRYQNIWVPRVIVPVSLADGVQLRVGMFGVLPPQVIDWNRRRIGGGLTGIGIVAAAQSQVDALRQGGADVVIALVHSGIGQETQSPFSENAARHVAAIDGVDVVVAGHVHERFPGPRYPLGPNIDSARGRLFGKPAVMPGAMAAYLGKIDLDLERAVGADGRVKWKIADHKSEVLSAMEYDEDPEIVAMLEPARTTVQARLQQVVGTVERPVTSYFSMVQDDCATRLVAEAMLSALKATLKGTQHEDVPLVASVAPARCGGREGPDSYVEVAAGALRERDVSEIQPFANYICLMRVTGAELSDWLEMANSLYNQLLPNRPDQLLFDRDAPPYKRETVFGVSYIVDLSQPAKYGLDGTLLRPHTRRIRDLCWQGAPLLPEQEFLLATNDFRGGGGGNFPAVDRDRQIAIPPVLVRDAVVQHLAQGHYVAGKTLPSWKFKRLPEVSAIFETGVQAQNFLHLIPTPLEPIGTSEAGFGQFRLNFGGEDWPN